MGAFIIVFHIVGKFVALKRADGQIVKKGLELAA